MPKQQFEYHDEQEDREWELAIARRNALLNARLCPRCLDPFQAGKGTPYGDKTYCSTLCAWRAKRDELAKRGIILR